MTQTQQDQRGLTAALGALQTRLATPAFVRDGYPGRPDVDERRDALDAAVVRVVGERRDGPRQS